MSIDDKKRQFTGIYEREADGLFRFCFLRTSNREQARDIAQDAFMRLWQTLMDGKDIVHERAFLYTVTRNLIIDWYRKSKSESLDALSDEGDAGEYPDMEAHKLITFSAEAREVLSAIRELDPIYREATYLRLVEEMLPQEIGRLLDLSANTVSVRVNRGIEQLRTRFKLD
ncbi:MAG: sigma-70 family RNA polymerase sigma factor [Candidatus Paceibacterota bacterium]|jgi:RNA polymerase sigma-70 factor (ECF subfamily)